MKSNHSYGKLIAAARFKVNGMHIGQVSPVVANTIMRQAVTRGDHTAPRSRKS